MVWLVLFVLCFSQYIFHAYLYNIKEMRKTRGFVVAFLEMLLVLFIGLAEEVTFQPLDERWHNEEEPNFIRLKKFRSQRVEREDRSMLLDPLLY